MRYRFEKYNVYDGAHQYFDRRLVFLAISALAIAIITTFGIINNRNDRSSPASVGTSQNEDSDEQAGDNQAQNSNPGDQPAGATAPGTEALGTQQPAATVPTGGRGGGSTAGGGSSAPTASGGGSTTPTGGMGGGTTTAPPPSGGGTTTQPCVLSPVTQICTCPKGVLQPGTLTCVISNL